MNEREICKQIIDFAFIAKAQLQSKETELIRSILTVLIIESEDVVEELDLGKIQHHQSKRARSAG